MKAMRAIWLEEGKLQLRDDLPVPAPRKGEALVRVVKAGICNTDIELTRGYYPYRGVLGHEFVGTVTEGPRALRGRRVVGEINAVCGSCPACTHGRPTHCENRTVLGIVGRDGAFAEHLTLPVENLHLVPDEVGDDAAAFAEPLAAALRIQEQIPIPSGSRLLVVGDGKLGQLVARTLAMLDCDLLVVGRHDRKLGLLAAAGIETRLREDPEDVSNDGAAGGASGTGLCGRFDIAVECTGDPSGFALARNALRPRGTLVMKSTYAGDLTFDASALVVDEITVIGSRCGPFEPALRLLQRGAIEVTDLIDARYSLADGIKAIAHARRRGVMKVLLEIG